MVGTLDQLPLEIRKEIYSHAFEESENTYTNRAGYYIIVYITSQLSSLATGRSGRKQFHSAAISHHHRDAKHRGKVYDRLTKQWVRAPPGLTSLLLVNRTVSKEASQVLYGHRPF